MPHTQTPPTEDEQLATYPAAIQQAIRSEAHAWYYDRIEPAIRSYDSHVEWARKLTPEQRSYHRSGAWYANQLLKATAISEVQSEMGDPTD
ncbi:hypothetical protein [Streptomyces sp. NRRL S-350]|uniref:hypothetical protein n=1 Tax=Streptomyces sp. NRRL S-350 TaxID=1463902 RepID=UPI0004C183A3|nr:hypothetical protein [Streptomyces sp. NRRL S-350]